MVTFFTVLAGMILASAEADRSGLDPDGFKKSVRVQDDLYQAVNGNWLETTEIPPDKSNYGSFIILDDVTQERIRELIERAAGSEHAPGSPAQKVADFFRSFMDEPRVEALGWTPVSEALQEISSLQSPADLVDYFGRTRRRGQRVPIGFFVSQDAKNSTRYLASVTQSGTTLPDRDYYLESDEKYAAARTALVDYVNRLFDIVHRESPGAAERILDLETRLAKAQWTRTELRDAEKRYNLFAVAELDELTPHLDWPAFFRAAEVGQLEEVNVSTPSFFQQLDAILREVPIETWRDYLTFQLLDRWAPYLSSDLVQAHFELHGRVLGGIPELKPRWKRAVEATSGAGAGDFGVLGDAVGQLYVAEYFAPQAKARMDELVANLLLAYRQSIDELTWMTAATKEKAQEKLAKINTKIGYTETWRDYSGLAIDPHDLHGNLVRSADVEYRRMIDKLGRPIDRTEWGMTPQTVNAYYSPSKNEIVFPAAILQPPFFNPQVDDAVNYGGIGAVIGHEISHAFDDQGSKYDGDGNLNNWWTDQDRQAFQQLADRLVAQYSEYSPLPGQQVNGELTLGENIADLSGLSIAHKAYRLALDGSTPTEIDGWTGDQRFFLGWSQVWRRKYRDAEMMRRLLTDPHAPSWYRANGPVVNIDAFYTAFDVQPGDALYKPVDERIRIW